MYTLLTNDETAPESTYQGKVDIRIIESIIDADDPDLLYDIRRNIIGYPQC